MTEPHVYLNGRMLPASEARLDIFDAGIVLGATVTEMMRTFQHHLFRLEEHLHRLERSLRYVRFDTGLNRDEFAAICQNLVAHNRTLIHPEDDLGLVVFITAGTLSMYAGSAGTTFGPTVCAHTFPLPFELWAEKLRHGVHLAIPSIRHVPPQCINPNMKCRSRMHYYLADQEARLVDPQAQALLLDLDGNVAETSNANFLMVEDGTIVSPSLRNTLPGISRQMVVELAAELGIDFVERDFQPFHAVNAEECLIASTPVCLLPVTRINKQPIGDGLPGPVFAQLQQAWSKRVGLDIGRQLLEGASRRPAPAAASSPKNTV